MFGNSEDEKRRQMQIAHQQQLEMVRKQADIDARKAASKALNNKDAKMLKKQGYTTIGGGINRYGMVQPSYTMMRGKDGNLDKRFTENLSPELQKISDKYSVDGDTTWATLQRQQLGQQFADARSNAAIQGDNAAAQAQEQLAMRGGARTGSRERMAMGGALSRMRGMQDIAAQERGQNLQLSISDEEMKNQALMDVGGQRQGVMQRNIDRLSQDVQGQNQFMGQKYKDDMAAYGARKQAEAQRKSSNSCFTPFTYIAMADGSNRAIKNVELGEVLREGGEVIGIVKAYSNELFNYKGVQVAGGHAVREGDKWIRVRNSDLAHKIPGRHLVYNLMTTNNLIFTANDIMWADFDETPYCSEIDDDDSLDYLNGKSVRGLL